MIGAAPESFRRIAALEPPRVDRSRGLLETVLVVRGEPVALERHLRRLRASAVAAFGAAPSSPALDEVRERVAGYERARLRIVAVPAGGGLALALDVEPERPDRGPADVQPVELRGALGPHKWRDRTALAELERAVAPALPLLVDPSGGVLEATRANIFAVRDGMLLTPPTDGRILPGVTRERVLEAARARGVDAAETRLPLDELLCADEVFVTSAIRGVQPVGCGGPIAALLAAALEDVR